MGQNTCSAADAAIANLKIGAHEEGKHAAKFAKTEHERLNFVFKSRLFAAVQISLLIAIPQGLSKIPAEKLNNSIRSLNDWITFGNPLLAINVEEPWSLAVSLAMCLGIFLVIWVIHHTFLSTVILQTALSDKPAYCRALLEAAEQHTEVREYVQSVNASGRQLRYFDLSGACAAYEDAKAKQSEGQQETVAAEERMTCAKLHSL